MNTPSLHTLLIDLIGNVATDYNLESDGKESIFHRIRGKRRNPDSLVQILRTIKTERPGTTIFRILIGTNQELIPFLCKVTIPTDKDPLTRELDGNELIFTYANEVTAPPPPSAPPERTLTQIKADLKRQAKKESAIT